MKRCQPKKSLALGAETIRVLDTILLEKVGGGGGSVAKGQPQCKPSGTCQE
jgi:hypothetical protein